MIKYIAPWLLILAAPCAFALKSDAQKIAQIKSDSVQYSNKTGAAKYVGHVHASQGSTTIDASELHLFRNADHDIDKVIAIGQPARYTTQPDGQTERFFASANIIEYYPQKGKIHLIKNGLAILGQDRFSGPRIRYDINQQLVESDASPEGQTTIILEPRRAPQKKSQ